MVLLLLPLIYDPPGYIALLGLKLVVMLLHRIENLGSKIIFIY